MPLGGAPRRPGGAARGARAWGRGRRAARRARGGAAGGGPATGPRQPTLQHVCTCGESTGGGEQAEAAVGAPSKYYPQARSLECLHPGLRSALPEQPAPSHTLHACATLCCAALWLLHYAALRLAPPALALPSPPAAPRWRGGRRPGRAAGLPALQPPVPGLEGYCAAEPGPAAAHAHGGCRARVCGRGVCVIMGGWVWRGVARMCGGG